MYTFVEASHQKPREDSFVVLETSWMVGVGLDVRQCHYDRYRDGQVDEVVPDLVCSGHPVHLGKDHLLGSDDLKSLVALCQGLTFSAIAPYTPEWLIVGNPSRVVRGSASMRRVSHSLKLDASQAVVAYVATAEMVVVEPDGKIVASHGFQYRIVLVHDSMRTYEHDEVLQSSIGIAKEVSMIVVEVTTSDFSLSASDGCHWTLDSSNSRSLSANLLWKGCVERGSPLSSEETDSACFPCYSLVGEGRTYPANSAMVQVPDCLRMQLVHHEDYHDRAMDSRFHTFLYLTERMNPLVAAADTFATRNRSERVVVAVYALSFG